jgi:hypothetical protein
MTDLPSWLPHAQQRLARLALEGDEAAAREFGRWMHRRLGAPDMEDTQPCPDDCPWAERGVMTAVLEKRNPCYECWGGERYYIPPTPTPQTRTDTEDAT